MSPRVRHAATLVVLAAVYFAAAKLGLSLASGVQQVTLVWPPTGIAVAATVLLSWRIWPALCVGAFLANVTAGETVPVALGIAAGNTAEAVAAGWLLRRAGFDPALARVGDVLALIGLAGAVATAIAASIGTASLCLGGIHGWPRATTIWWTWWVGDALSVLILAPFLLTWSPAGRVPRAPGRPLEAALLGAVLVGATVFIYGRDSVWGGVEYLAFPLVIWGAMRFGQQGAAAVTLLVAVIAIGATTQDHGPFAARAPAQEPLPLQLHFLAVMSITALVLGAVMAGRTRAEARLRADQRVSQILAQADSLAAAAPLLLRAVGETLSWDVGALWRRDSGSDALTCVDVWRGQGTRAPEFVAETRRRTFAPGIGLPGRVAASGRPAWIADVVRDANFPRAEVAAREGLHAAFAFPVRAGSATLGVVEFFSAAILRPDAALLAMVEAIGAQIGQFVERTAVQEELRAVDQRKDEFLATLAHELRNPLAPLANALQLLRLQGGGGQQPALAMADRQLHTLVRLVDDLLDVARFTRGRIELKLTRVGLADVVERGVETSRALLDERRHELRLDLPRDPVWLHVDVTRIAQVVANLLNNAARYSEPGQPIQLTANVTEAGEPGWLTLRVRDAGIGIAPDMLKRIFHPFMQAEQARSRASGGLGIGLALVKRLVELHGGEVSAHSAGAGQGSEFVVRLPLATAAPLAPAAPLQPGEPVAPLFLRRVLVVDDNVDSLASLRLLLETMGHEVACAEDGEAAVASAAAFAPDVVLLDIGLPRLDGYGAAARIRRLPNGRSVVLVALTGWGQEEDRRRAQQAGFDLHVVKPMPRETLARILAIRRAEPADA